MSLPARVYTFVPLARMKSLEFNNEFDNPINILNGTTTDKSIRIRNSDSAFAAGRFDQIAASGNILEFYQGGSAKVSVENTGKVKSLITDGSTAPFEASQAILCPLVNADKVDGFDLTGNKTAFSFGWFYSVPPGATEATNPSVHSFIVPAGTSITILDIVVVFTGGSHTSGASLVWTIKRRNSSGTLQTDVGTATLDNTNNTIWIPYSNNVTDVPLSTGDILYPLLTTRSGTVTETLVTVAIRGVQSFTS